MQVHAIEEVLAVDLPSLRLSEKAEVEDMRDSFLLFVKKGILD